MSGPPAGNATSIDPALLRKLSRLMRKAKRAHGLAHAATLLKAAIREARDGPREDRNPGQRRG